jgi:hypothetical protein
MMDLDYHINYIGFADPYKDRSVLKDAMGRYRTNLFAEFNTSVHEDYPPLYTMKEEPYCGLPSAYLIYMHSDSEYEAAMKLVGSWLHWQRLTRSKPFLKGMDNTAAWVGLEDWRKEKEIKDKAFAYNQLKISAAGGNVAAQKLIFEGEKTTRGRAGRPSRAEIAKAAADQAKLDASLKDDMSRIKLATQDGKQTRNN